MNLLDELLARYVTAPMSEAGFHRAGRTYTAGSPRRDTVLVQVRPYGLSGSEGGFHIEWAAIPAAAHDYYREENPGAAPDVTWGVVSGRVVVPERLRRRVYETTLWTFRAADLDTFGAAVGEHLKSLVIPKWPPLLSPDRLAAALTHPELTTHDFSIPLHPVAKRLVIYIDSGDAAVLRRQLDEAEELLPGEEWIPWLRNRLANRSR